jgi:Rod binding domain-containing protein
MSNPLSTIGMMAASNVTPQGKPTLSIEQSKALGLKPTIDQAAKSFEGLFMQTIMKEMRNSKLGDGILDSDEQEPFQSMLDNSYAQLMTNSSNFGIADAIKRQFSKAVGSTTPKSGS